MKLPKTYEPSAYESDIYALWERSGGFQPHRASHSDSYTIVIPPPNANGNLHLGHGLTLTLEDIAIRYHRMRGRAALFLPGADHAGFETQVVYEKELAKAGKSRFDFSREELYQQIWDFVAQNKDNYQSQFRRLGASLDWTRFTFTLDDKIVQSAYATFKKMWDDGLIYRGERLVNFCTFHGTAFADIEVTYTEEQSSLWHIQYPLTDGSGYINVATTRPETMLGDTAVAVHPEDTRYASLVGRTVRLPLTNRDIPIIADEMVDREFGTGAVKITPAHDPNDYEVAERHDLPKITVISNEGKITHDTPGDYQGLEVLEARERIVRDLESQGFLISTEDHTHNVGHCYKCGTIIQPLLREQWFINMQPLAAEAIRALEAGKITFYPDSKKAQLIRYLQGLRDWNISRQIAWGIPIPAFQNLEDPEDWVFDTRVGQELIEIGGKTYRRDPDVFDTWFSSSSWPYATLGGPGSDDFNQFYPISLMETAADILYPWVSRMIMFGLYVTGDVPFPAVYLHGLIQDEHGQKMSKSKGNVIDPMDIMDEYGADAFRAGIVTGETAASNRPFDRSKIVGARNFCNKLWNVARFIEGRVDLAAAKGELKAGEAYAPGKPEPQTSADHWMLLQLQRSIEQVSADLEAYRFSEAFERVYHLLWDDFADWYVEASKSNSNLPLLVHGLETILKLAHPFVPFVTETIWQTLPWTGDSILMTSRWPEALQADKTRAQEFADIQTIVSEVRFMKNQLSLSDVIMYYTDVPFITANADLIKRLTRLTAVTEVTAGQGLHLTQTRHRCWLDVDHETAQRYLENLQDKKASQEQAIARLQGRLANDSYVRNAPPQLVNETKQQLAEAEQILTNITQEYERFSSASKGL